MKIAFTSSGNSWESLIDPRFGRTEYLLLFDEESQQLTAVDNSPVKDDAHGAGTATSQLLFDLKPDVLITGNGPGQNAVAALKHIKMDIFIHAHDLTIRQAYEKYKQGLLSRL